MDTQLFESIFLLFVLASVVANHKTANKWSVIAAKSIYTNEK